MTSDEYMSRVDAYAVIARFHVAMTPTHQARDCELCRSLLDQQLKLAQQSIEPASISR